MARSIAVIHNDLLAKKAADPVLGVVLTSESAVSVYRNFLYIVAACAWTIETLHDLFKREVNETIASMKPHSERWYAEMAKKFQYGFDLVDESDVYDNEGYTADEIADSKIVSYAAVVQQERGIRIKVAKTVGADLGPLEVAELDAFKQYMKEVKDAGVKALITSGPADELLLDVTVEYDALVLNANGERIDGNDPAPVAKAIREHLKNLPFNGIFSLQKLVDAIQAVDGVNDLQVNQVQTKYGLLPFTSFAISMVPDAGYLRIQDANLTLTYIAAE